MKLSFAGCFELPVSQTITDNLHFPQAISFYLALPAPMIMVFTLFKYLRLGITCPVKCYLMSPLVFVHI